MIVWILIAAIISFIGQPLVRFLDKVHVWKWRIPHALSAGLSLLFLVLMFFGLIAIFVPLIVSQAETISKIDVNLLAHNLQGPLQWLNDKSHDLGLIPARQSLEDFIVMKAKSVVNIGSVSTVINGFFEVAGMVFVGMVSVLFIAFFLNLSRWLYQFS